MKETELICIGCPMGCALRVEQDTAGAVRVAGNSCPRGEEYARKEVTNPTRTVAGSVRVYGSRTGAVTVSCRTRGDIPKGKVLAAAAALKDVSVAAPVKIGDVLVRNAAQTGVDFIATKNVE